METPKKPAKAKSSSCELWAVLLDIDKMKCTAVFVEIFFITLSIWNNNWTWFGRSGGLLTLIGGVLAARKFIRCSIVEMVHDETHEDLGNVTDEPKCDPEKEEDIKAGKAAAYLIFIGTLVWTFGDLLNVFFSK